MKKIKQTFKFKPFSKKQRMVLNWWCDTSPVKDMDGIIADGAIRSGKTVCMSLSFVMWAMTQFNGQNLYVIMEMYMYMRLATSRFPKDYLMRLLKNTEKVDIIKA